MRVIFLTLVRINNIEEKGIYHDLLKKFAAEGHEVVVVTPNERRFKQESGLTSIGNIKILEVKTPNIQKTNIVEKGIGTLMVEFLYERAIRKYFDLQSFDIVLYSTPPITFTGLIRKLKAKHTKTYLLLKDIFPQNAVDLGMLNKKSPLYFYFRKREKQLYRISDWIGCMSPANVDYLLKHNPGLSAGKVEVNPNSFALTDVSDGEPDSSIREKYGIPEGKTVFVYGGNLGKPQGLDFLPKVIDHCKSISNAFFIIVGNGTEYPKIKEWYDREKPKNVLLLYYVPNHEYRQLVKLAHVGLIFLNRNFTIPNYPSRLLSYMESRMPVICATDVNTDVGTMAEENGYGFYCENGDLEGFAKYVKLLTEDHALLKEMGIQSYRYLSSHFNVDLSYNQIINKI